MLVSVLYFVYLLVPFLIILTVYLAKIFDFRYHLNANAGLINFTAFYVITFPLPMATAHFVIKKNLGAAFQFGYISKLIGASLWSYIGAYLLYFLAAIITFIALPMIPFIGWILSSFVGFYFGCVTGFLYGSVYSKAECALSGNDS